MIEHKQLVWTLGVILLLCESTTHSMGQGHFEDGLLGYWPLDGNFFSFDGDKHAEGYGNDPIAFDDEGKFGQAIRLDGVDQFVEITGGVVEDFDGVEQPISVSCWFKPDPEYRDFGTLVAKGIGFEWSLDAFIGNNSTGVRWAAGVSTEYLFGREVDFGDGSWHHAVGVVDTPQGTSSLWIDGVLSREGSASSIIETYRVSFGGVRHITVSRFFQGWIDDVAIWKRTLHDEEIETIWNGGQGHTIRSLIPDEDADGMPDYWEGKAGLQVGIDDGREDPDGDGILNLAEFQGGSSPNAKDTDGDGVPDAAETRTHRWISASDRGTDPALSDSDKDGLADSIENPEETFAAGVRPGSDPNLKDTDGDGFDDGAEHLANTDPSDPEMFPGLDLNLVSVWPFDGDFEDKHSMHHGTPTGIDEITFENGKIGKAVRLNGVDQFIEIVGKEANAYRFANSSFSISLWYRSDAQPDDGTTLLLSHGETLNEKSSYWFILRTMPVTSHVIYFDPGRERFHVPGHEGRTHDEGLHHLVAVFDRSSLASRVYIDGTKVGPAMPLVSLRRRIEDPTPGLRIGGSSFFTHVNWSGLIDDVAIWGRALTGREVLEIYNGGEGVPVLQFASGGDEDQDDLPDEWETQNGLQLGFDDSAGDPDDDHSSNLDEFLNGTDPQDPDTDDDGYLDGAETGTRVWISVDETGTDPRNMDTDGDGLADNIENPDVSFVGAEQPGTNPNLEDTDGDGIDDLLEIRFGSDPTDPNSVHRGNLEVGLLAYWPLDGDLDDQVADSHGTGMGTAPLEYGAGKFGNAVVLNGIDQFIEINPENEELFDFPDAHGFSISAWFRVDAFDKSWQTLAAKGEGSRWRVHRAGMTDVIAFSGGSVDIWAPDRSIADGEIHHVAAVSDPANEHVRLFIDGELVSQGDRPFLDNGEEPMWIGANPDIRLASPNPAELGEQNPGARSWNGLVDDVAIWNRALLEEEIDTIFNKGTPIRNPVVFQILDAKREGLSDVRITWTSKPDRIYSVEKSGQLTRWDELDDNVQSEGAVTSYLDTDAIEDSAFYRVVEHGDPANGF